MRPATFLNSLLALTLLTVSMQPSVSAQNKSGKPFQLHATQDGQSAPTLSRQHDVSNKDPFSGTNDEGELLDAPKYKADPIPKPKISKPLRGNVDDGGAGNFQQPISAPQDMSGEPDMMPQRVQQPPQQPAFNPNDPDQSPDLQLAWDAWHRRVAQCIFERFNFFAKAAFKHSPPVMAKLSYQVTREGHIVNLNMTQKSTNVLFNVLCFQAVKSLDGDLSILQFPDGSRRMWVPKSGIFTQNYGGAAGFKYTVGDQETLRGAGRR